MHSFLNSFIPGENYENLKLCNFIWSGILHLLAFRNQRYYLLAFINCKIDEKNSAIEITLDDFCFVCNVRDLQYLFKMNSISNRIFH